MINSFPSNAGLPLLVGSQITTPMEAAIREALAWDSPLAASIDFTIRPEAPAIDCSMAFSRLWSSSQVSNQARAFSRDIESVWRENGASLNADDRFQVNQAISKFLSDLNRLGSRGLLTDMRRLWGSIPYTTNQTAAPRISSPVDSALGHLNGLLLLRQNWGRGVSECWREADFASPIRYDIGRDFHVTLSPGSHETVAGIDYRLVWEGLDVSGEKRTVALAVVGFICRRDGFGITLVQGGPRLTEIKIAHNGKPTDLLKLTQRRFVQDPRAWLLQEVIRTLRKDFSDPGIYWLRAERRAPLYGHVMNPLSPNHPLFQQVGELPLPELRELVRKSPSDTTRLAASIQRLDRMAESLGFRPESEDGAWWVLPRYSS